MQVVELRAENVKRLSAVKIRPDGAAMVVVAGENEAGKSSVLDSIQMALGGTKAAPEQPVRKGHERAMIVLDLGDLVVTRVFHASGGTSLKVTNRDGMAYPSPQALLDGLIGRLTFDPLAFAEMDAEQQAKTLRALAGIDTTDLDLEHKRLYDERTLVNRDAKQAEAAAAKAPSYPGVPSAVVDSVALVQALSEADREAALAAAAQSEVAKIHGQLTARRQAVAACEKAIERLREQMATAEEDLMIAEAAAQQAETMLSAAKSAARHVAGHVPNRDALRSELADIEQTNAKVRDNQRKAELLKDAAQKKATSERLTARLNDIAVEKAQMLERAKFPIDGLGLGEVGVTWNGLPFSQASTAVRVRVSVAIGLALNPKLKILLVRNGNDLGSKNLTLIAEMAAQAGAQVWLERIAGGEGQTTVVIEDGTVVEEVVA